jgi:nucleotide-binding universal stress UspA family protein
MPRLTQQQLEDHLWGAANILRGRTAGQDYKTYILSLMFFKRLSDQWDFEADDRIDLLERERGRPFTDAQRQTLRARGALHRFTIPAGCHWADVLQASENVGEVLTSAMRGMANANQELLDVFSVDWNQPAPDGTGKLIANEIVSALVQHFHTVNLSNPSVQPGVIGRAYEYLIKQFADDAGAKAGAFFTLPKVVDLPMFTKIVLPVDLSDRHRPVVNLALDLARQAGGEVVLLHVIEEMGGVGRDEERALDNRLEQAAQQHLERLGSEFESRKVLWQAAVRYGRRAPQIARYAVEAGADLIVLPAPRFDSLDPGGGWGSLSWKVGFLVLCPVLLVK